MARSRRPNPMNDAVKTLRRARKVAILSHVNPDGDTLGCQLALGLALMRLGKHVSMLNPDGVPTRFQFLPGSELVRSRAPEGARFDAAVAVDCGGRSQLGKLEKAFFRAKTTIQIDHHDFGDAFGKIQVLEEEASAVGEIVYDMIRALRVEVTPAIATCILTSIIVDTGAFRFSNIRPKTFDVCGDLVKKGVDLLHLIEESYWKKTRSCARLSGHCVANSHFSQDGRLAWTTVYQRDFKRYHAKLPDVDAVADDLRAIEGVKIAAVFRETDKKRFRVSLRSRHGINVAMVARQFGGGGHHNSAGCSIRNLESEKQKLLTELDILLE